jgi:hypothetical protein
MRTFNRRVVAATLLAAACALSLPAAAAVRIVQIYSTPDGDHQAILLEDDARDRVDRFNGLTLIMQDREGRSRIHTLTPGRTHEDAILVDGRRRFLVATRPMARWFRTQAELPDAFLDVAGGTLAIFGGEARDYPSLPATNAIAFDAATGEAQASNAYLARHPVSLDDDTPAALGGYFAKPPPGAMVREYYNARLDRYALAVSQREKADFDMGRRPGWDRTGKYFRSLDSTSGIATVPVCRYYLPPPHGDTHFYSAFEEECAAVARMVPGAVLEAAEAFRAALPDPGTGLCLPEASSADPLVWLMRTRPLFRSFNARADTNHRYTTSLAVQADMVWRGWIAEGHGPHGTAMCVDAFDMGVIKHPKVRPHVERGSASG